MILIFEMTWAGHAHATFNSSLIQTVLKAFPDQEIRFHCTPAHYAAVRDRLPDAVSSAIRYGPIALSPLYPGRQNFVSYRRFWTELRELLDRLSSVDRAQRCLVVLASSPSTGVFAATLAARLLRLEAAVQVVMHGDLNTIRGWRSRNPLSRRLDFRSVLAARHPVPVRPLLLEPSIRDALARIDARLAGRCDVLPHPVPAERPEHAPQASTELPFRVALVGQGTKDKGMEAFLKIAQAMKQRHGAAVEFHHIGRTVPGTDAAALAVLADPPSYEGLPYDVFVERLAKVHAVFLPLQTSYYDLSASGALVDAVNWQKPIITPRIGLTEHYFKAYGEIGFLYTDPSAALESVEAAFAAFRSGTLASQTTALARARQCRTPDALAPAYRALVIANFPGWQDASALACRAAAV